MMNLQQEVTEALRLAEATLSYTLNNGSEFVKAHEACRDALKRVRDERLRKRNTKLAQIVSKLDALDNEDFFGTEGWRHYFGME